jgi:hypothetical protein
MAERPGYVVSLPELGTATAATVDLVPQLGRDGDEVIVVVMKQLFHVDRRDRVHRIAGAKLRVADEPWDGGRSSIRFPSDVCIRKPSTDVVVAGRAVGVYEPRVTHLDVLVRVGPVSKVLRVFGPRVWYRGLTGVVLSDPAPFVSTPVCWEDAFGGSDDSDPAKLLEEPRNPVGRGLARDPSKLIDQPGPRIEDPTDVIASHRSRPAPGGLCALARRAQEGRPRE